MTSRKGGHDTLFIVAIGESVELRHLLNEPELELTDDRWHGCTPLAARALWLFSYRRCVTVSRSAGLVRIDTRRFWVMTSTRTIRIEDIARIVCRAQGLPTVWRPWYALAGGSMVDSDVALYYVALSLRRTEEEVPLFTLLESLPMPDGVVTKLTGGSDGDRVGDEGVARLVTQLHDYLGLPIGRR